MSIDEQRSVLTTCLMAAFPAEREFLTKLASALGMDAGAPQAIEQIGRKLLGGLVGSIGGGLLGGVDSLATGAAFSLRQPS